MISRLLGHLAVPGLLLFAAACGGKLDEDRDAPAATGGVSTGGRDTGGGTPGGGGAVAGGGPSGGSVALGGSAGRSGGAAGEVATGGVGPLAPECLLPQEVGECDDAIPVFWHDPQTGVCMPSVYGGCGGSANRFATRDECQAACRGAAPGVIELDTCTTSADCALDTLSCCGGCEPATEHHFVAIREDARDAFRTHTGCFGVQCEPCFDPVPSERTARYYYPVCVEGQCTIRDLRATPLTECTRAEDCVLRCSASCCELCDASRVVALRADVDAGAEFCGGGSATCDDCDCALPEPLAADCEAGRCVVRGEAVCTVGLDWTCNASILSSWIAGVCNEDGTCTCSDGHALDPTSGRCN